MNDRRPSVIRYQTLALSRWLRKRGYDLDDMAIVYAVMIRPDVPITVSTISEMTGISRRSVLLRLRKGEADGGVRKVKGGWLPDREMHAFDTALSEWAQSATWEIDGIDYEVPRLRSVSGPHQGPDR